MRHSTFNMRTICLLAALSGITVLSAQTPGKPRVQTGSSGGNYGLQARREKAGNSSCDFFKKGGG